LQILWENGLLNYWVKQYIPAVDGKEVHGGESKASWETIRFEINGIV